MNDVARFEEQSVTYRPLGSDEDMQLKVGYVTRYLAQKTRSGKSPSPEEVIKFMQLCKSQKLNPWTGDAYLLGYDGKEGATFTLITAIQALLKRAELNADFDGISSGVIVVTELGVIIERTGAFLHPGDTLAGGWSIVRRKNTSDPFEAKVQLKTYNTERSRWSVDPSGMIEKVARAAALRVAFPSDLGAMYTVEEMGHVVDGSIAAPAETPAELIKRVTGQEVAPSEPEPVDAVEESSPESIHQYGLEVLVENFLAQIAIAENTGDVILCHEQFHGLSAERKYRAALKKMAKERCAELEEK